MLIALSAIREAQSRLAGSLTPTPCVRSESYSRVLDAEVYLKLELFQPTRSFKVRGALNSILQLSTAQRARGVITASGGNHGFGVCHAAALAGVEASVFLPETTHPSRMEMVRQLGGRLHLHGNDWNAANDRALKLAEAEGLHYISPFDHEHIMAGQGTIALEILEQLPEVEVIVVSIGGGGLISGIASAARQVRPEVRVIGVETKGADCVAQSLDRGELVEIPSLDSIAKSLGTRKSSERPLSIIREAVERVVVVPDESAVREMIRLLEEQNLLAEPAATCTLAALVDGLVPDLEGKTIAAVICGGNVGLAELQRWREQFGLD